MPKLKQDIPTPGECISKPMTLQEIKAQDERIKRRREMLKSVSMTAQREFVYDPTKH